MVAHVGGSHFFLQWCSVHVFIRLILQQRSGASNDIVYGWFAALRAHSVEFLLLTAAFACARVCFVRRPASWVRARRWCWASGVTSVCECCHPASVLWVSVDVSGWGNWSVWVVIIAPFRAHIVGFLLLTAACTCVCVRFVRRPASWVRARRWWWASGVTSDRECYRPASVLWGGVGRDRVGGVGVCGW
jgi:hypothetical protein